MARNLRPLNWAPRAKRDLIDIWLYVADAASPETADKVVRKIEQASFRLSNYPMSGRPRTDIGTELKSRLASPYIVFYRVNDAAVEIARVLHGRRDVAAAFEEPDA